MEQRGDAVHGFALAAIEGVVGVGGGADLGQAAVAVVGQHTETGDVAGVAGEVGPVGVGAGIGQGVGGRAIAVVRGRAGAGFGLAVAVGVVGEAEGGIEVGAVGGGGQAVEGVVGEALVGAAVEVVTGQGVAVGVVRQVLEPG